MINNTVQQIRSVSSQCFPLSILLTEKYTVDFYQREYVWERKQLEDLINDLSTSFLSCYRTNHTIEDVEMYDPYFMGEIVLSKKPGENALIDGQQRITTFTLLLIFMLHKFKNVPDLQKHAIESLIFSYRLGRISFNLDIAIRNPCMDGLFRYGRYEPNDNDRSHVQNIVDRYNDIEDCWDERINETNIASFESWIIEKVIFSKVVANSDDFAYMIFETMNDRGLSLSHVEMLRSYMLANITPEVDPLTKISPRDVSLNTFNRIIERLNNIKLPSKSKAESEFFRVFLRSHYAETLQKGDQNSDFARIGNAFHRWVRERKDFLKLNESRDYVSLISEFDYYSKQYELIYKLISERNTKEYLYLTVNSDYGFTLQPALILASIKYNDNEIIVKNKIKIVSKYLTKILSYRVWNYKLIGQSSMETEIYGLCKLIRNSDVEDLNDLLYNNQIVNMPSLDNSPMLTQQNKPKLRVLIALITEIIARESGVPDYILNRSDIEVEHIWSDHYEQHTDEFNNREEFSNTRNNIGDLLLLPKSFNASYGKEPYEVKVEQYFSQNILAQTLNSKMYINHPDFLRFKEKSNLDFKSYEHFKKLSINERAALYKNVLIWNWNNWFCYKNFYYLKINKCE